MKAFPHMAHIHQSLNNTITKEEIISGGMDLRDYFAAKAMQGFLTIHPRDWQDMYPDSEPMIANVPKLAYQFADAMMEARNEK